MQTLIIKDKPQMDKNKFKEENQIFSFLKCCLHPKLLISKPQQ